MCVCVFERERETSDEGEGDPAATLATGVRYLGLSTIHIAGQLLVSSGGHFCGTCYIISKTYDFQIHVFKKIDPWPTVVI